MGMILIDVITKIHTSNTKQLEDIGHIDRIIDTNNFSNPIVHITGIIIKYLV